MDRMEQERDETNAIEQALRDVAQWRNKLSCIDNNQQKHQELNKAKKRPDPRDLSTGPPSSSTYLCHRCNQPGHYISRCPTNGDKAFNVVRRSGCAGIPRSFLKAATEEEAKKDISIMRASDGSYYHAMAPRTAVFDKIASDVLANKRKAPPTHLSCTLCNGLFRDPLSMPCCRVSFCHQCIISPYECNEENVSCPYCKKYVTYIPPVLSLLTTF